MDSDWEEFTFEQLKSSAKSALAMGPFGSRIKAENFVMFGVPVIKGGNLNGNFINENEFDYLTDEKAKELSSSVAIKGDIVITHRGTIGQVGIIPAWSKFDKYIVSQSLGFMRSEKEKQTRPPKQREDACCCSATEQHWWKSQHDGAN